MASHRLSLALAALAALSALAAPARASDCGEGTLVSSCINDDTLWPHAGPSRFVSVGGTETVVAGHAGFGLVTSYLSRPVVLRVPFASGADLYAINDQVNGTFLWAYGVTDRLELDLATPVTFGQGGTGVEPVTGSSRLRDTALRDMRFGVAYNLIRNDGKASIFGAGFGLTARFEIVAPTGDKDQLAGERTAVVAPSVAADYHRGKWHGGLEVGARVRPVTQLLNARVGTQGLLAIGAGYDVLDRSRLMIGLEAYMLPTFAEQATITQSALGLVSAGGGGSLIPAEWTLSAKSAPFMEGDMGFQLGVGGGIPLSSDAITVPRFRVTLGLRYAPGAHDRDGDGVIDADDRCPSQPGPRPTGCPPPPEAAPVGLDLKSARDVCTSDPDSVDGFDDKNGCPDEDGDKDGVDDRYDRCPLQSEDDFSGKPDGCPTAPAAPAPAPTPLAPAAAPPSPPAPPAPQPTAPTPK